MTEIERYVGRPTSKMRMQARVMALAIARARPPLHPPSNNLDHTSLLSRRNKYLDSPSGGEFDVILHHTHHGHPLSLSLLNNPTQSSNAFLDSNTINAEGGNV